MSQYAGSNRRRRNHHGAQNEAERERPKGPEWRPITTRVKGQAAIQVSELPLPIPRYSFRVGTAHFTPDEVFVKPHLTIHNYRDAAELLLELGQKYENLRQEDIQEREQLRAQWTDKEDDA